MDVAESTAQGNDINVIKTYNENSIWAAGYVGTLMHSTNGGLDWEIRNVIGHTKTVNFSGIDFPEIQWVLLWMSLVIFLRQPMLAQHGTQYIGKWMNTFMPHVSQTPSMDILSVPEARSFGQQMAVIYGPLITLMSPWTSFPFASLHPRLDTQLDMGIFSRPPMPETHGPQCISIQQLFSRALYFHPSSKDFSIDDYGRVLKTTDGGMTWTSWFW
ncbi:MAG: hypothetical protein M0C28_41240 [Candidatus Moduliflexus flocculans]|nr:hypothetical protein [Candidatus Moduliflexus flocculans]